MTQPTSSSSSSPFVMAAIPFIPGVPPFWIVLLDNIGLASLVAMGLVLLTGVGGLTSFGQAAFCRLRRLHHGGADHDLRPVALADACRCRCWSAASLAVLLGIVTVRLSGHYLPLGTIAWGHRAVLTSSASWNSSAAMTASQAIPPLSIGSFRMISSGTIYFAIWIAVLVSALLTMNLLDSRTGRAIRALRRGHIAGRSLWRADAARQASGVHLCGGAGRPCPAGSTRISSAPPIRRRSAPRPASNTCSSRWSAAPVMSGAAFSAPAIVVILKEVLAELPAV